MEFAALAGVELPVARSGRIPLAAPAHSRPRGCRTSSRELPSGSESCRPPACPSRGRSRRPFPSELRTTWLRDGVPSAPATNATIADHVRRPGIGAGFRRSPFQLGSSESDAPAAAPESEVSDFLPKPPLRPAASEDRSRGEEAADRELVSEQAADGRACHDRIGNETGCEGRPRVDPDGLVAEEEHHEDPAPVDELERERRTR